MGVIDYAGEDNLMVGTDYRHADYSDDIEAIQTLAHGGKISPSLAQKILGNNPKRLYGCECPLKVRTDNQNQSAGWAY